MRHEVTICTYIFYFLVHTLFTYNTAAQVVSLRLSWDWLYTNSMSHINSYTHIYIYICICIIHIPKEPFERQDEPWFIFGWLMSLNCDISPCHFPHTPWTTCHTAASETAAWKHSCSRQSTCNAQMHAAKWWLVNLHPPTLPPTK